MTETVKPALQTTPQAAQMLHQLKNEFHSFCQQHKNAAVYVQTLNGQTYHGTIENVDGAHLYLKLSADQAERLPGALRPIYPPYAPYAPYPPQNPGNVILPLVLYELLVISLL